MNPLALILGNLRLAGIAGAALAAAGAFWWLSDKIGDSRELDTRNAIARQERHANEAEIKGRARARACHARGPLWLWNVEAERCDEQPALSRPGR